MTRVSEAGEEGDDDDDDDDDDDILMMPHPLKATVRHLRGRLGRTSCLRGQLPCTTEPPPPPFPPPGVRDLLRRMWHWHARDDVDDHAALTC
jgi:hypothetical protein